VTIPVRKTPTLSAQTAERMGTQSRFGEGKRENKAWPTRQYVVAGGGFLLVLTPGGASSSPTSPAATQPVDKEKGRPNDGRPSGTG
jgi:hypothetical protein